MSDAMPSVFVGHGNPMNAVQENDYTRGWAALGTSLPRPRAILAVSAHWYIEEAAVTLSASPRTIHDFGGVPRELYRVQYPAPGAPDLARRVGRLLEPLPVRLDEEWGLDHGTWAVLCHVYPRADIPVVQLSIDATRPPAFHFDIGRRLAALREEGVLVVGSGNLVHNLHAYAWGRHTVEPFEWAVAFESRVRELLLAGDTGPLVEYESRLGREALLAAPTPDHYLPMLYVAGTRLPGDAVSFPVEGVDGGSISMLAVEFGGK